MSWFKINPYLTYYNKTFMDTDSFQRQLRIRGCYVYSDFVHKDYFWFRLFNRGFSFIKRDLKFSEREGKSKYLRFRGWVITRL